MVLHRGRNHSARGGVDVQLYDQRASLILAPISTTVRQPFAEVLIVPPPCQPSIRSNCFISFPPGEGHALVIHVILIMKLSPCSHLWEPCGHPFRAAHSTYWCTLLSGYLLLSPGLVTDSCLQISLPVVWLGFFLASRAASFSGP